MKFEAPEVEIIAFDEEDVIRTSSIVTEEDIFPFSNDTNPINNIFSNGIN